MDWTQALAIMSITVGSLFFFYKLTREDMLKVNQNMERMETHHREDVQELRNGLKEMDAKWERLFERLLIQDQQKKSS